MENILLRPASAPVLSQREGRSNSRESKNQPCLCQGFTAGDLLSQIIAEGNADLLEVRD